MALAANWKFVLAPMAVAGLCVCQESAPSGIIRGDLLSWSGDAHRGELVFRNAENRVYQCSFDDRTYFERLKERVVLSSADQGGKVEVLSDRKDGTGLCYARIVHFLEPLPVRAIAAQRVRLRPVRSTLDQFAPRGDQTFAGVVLKIGSGELVLRTRSNERKTILLRPDTRYLGEGQAMELSNLPVSTRVFIRAGHNFDGELEAYQIIWGDILEPVLTPRYD